MTRAPAHDPASPALLRAVAVVPARLASTRLARKMLLAESGRPLFCHTAESVACAASVERVIVATDSEEILAAGAEAGVETRLTSDAHQSGTDRVHEAYEALAAETGREWDVVLNVQGDEPEVDGEDLDRLVSVFHDPSIEAATLWGAVRTEEEARDPSVVKVVCNARGDALYFTRGSAPARTHSRPGAKGLEALKRHIGVYAFRPRALRAFCSLPQGELERTENLEQLRWLEAGRRMRAVPARKIPRGIDTREDYEAFLARFGSGESLTRTPS